MPAVTPRDVEWAHLTGPEIREVAADPAAIAILPVGSLEQHGPHLPVFTDTRSASEAAIRAARLLDGTPPALVLPGMWTGMSEHHLPFGGTISLNYAEFHGVLRGVTRSLRALGFRRLLMVNGHGGNIDPLAVSARELAHEFGLAVVATTPWASTTERIAPLLERQRNVQHACEAETSLMMRMTPALVRRDRLEDAVQQAPAPREGRPGYSRFWSFSERAPVTGTRGDPRAGTPEKGEAILQILAEELAAAIRDPALWHAPDDVWAPGRGQGPTVPG
ncbi:creatininase family protein [Roseomonas elaeocarpi]|uniref:Creatininase family protein n=1 Tax=Roseomonas elaeocarpi TaxID=907779 RepID=A0ABV6JW45_9PROT